MFRSETFFPTGLQALIKPVIFIEYSINVRVNNGRLHNWFKKKSFFFLFEKHCTNNDLSEQN